MQSEQAMVPTNAGASPRIAMVAGEASGDLLASLLLGGMRARWPELRAAGIGGPKMASQGFDAWWSHERLSVFGFVDALKHYREISGIREQLAQRLLQDRPNVFVGVDAPDFNLGLEARLKAHGVKTVHFVSPSIWAWRGGRIHKIARSADHVLCLFPFEPEIYHAQGIAATYVGHPLADAIPLASDRDGARQRLGLSVSDAVVAVLPGSRRSEIAHIAPTFLQTVARLSQLRPNLRFVLPAVPSLRSMIDPLVATHAPNAPLTVVDGQSHDALAACDVTLIASGTATLEAALFKRPMVIAYKVSTLSWLLMKNLGYLPWVGLPNILLRDFVVPERLQQAATPDQLATDVLAWLDDPRRVAHLQAQFQALHQTLRQDTAHRATEAIAAVLSGGAHG